MQQYRCPHPSSCIISTRRHLLTKCSRIRYLILSFLRVWESYIPLLQPILNCNPCACSSTIYMGRVNSIALSQQTPVHGPYGQAVRKVRIRFHRCSKVCSQLRWSRCYSTRRVIQAIQAFCCRKKIPIACSNMDGIRVTWIVFGVICEIIEKGMIHFLKITHRA